MFLEQLKIKNMKTKIIITESQLKMLSEQSQEQRLDMDEYYSGPLENESNEELESIFENLHRAVVKKDWDIVYEVYNDLSHYLNKDKTHSVLDDTPEQERERNYGVDDEDIDFDVDDKY